MNLPTSCIDLMNAGLLILALNGIARLVVEERRAVPARLNMDLVNIKKE